MPFDINVAFNVQTQELVNARNALQSLTQAARELNTNQDKAVKTAEKLVDVNEKLASSASSASKAAEKSEKATKSLAGEGDAAATKLARLKDQLSFLRDDLNLSEVGFTKSQAGVLAWAKSVGATNDIIKQFANTFDNLNKVTGSNPFDQSAKGLSSLSREFYELIAIQDLAASGFGLTAKQVQMLSRDIESLQQQNRAFGRDANDGVDKLRAEFLDAANSVNSYRDQIKAAQQANESLFKQEQELARHRNSANNELMKTWADGVGKRSQAMEQLSAQYAQEAKAAASAEKVAADAIAYTDRETRRLIETNDLLSRGFTSSSANAIFKYKESLEKTGISAIDLKQKLYLLEQDLVKRQGTSPFAKMREDIKQVTQQTNHLARAISVQLGDVAISLAGGQNPFVVLLQQGDQIRGAVQQAVDAGQSIDKAMKGAFVSMANSAKLVGVVIKEFVADGLRSVGDALNVVTNQMARNSSINKQFADGTITATRHARLLEQASLQNAKALGTLRLVALGTAAAFAVALVAAYVSLSKEQDAVAKSNVQFGASFGASTQEALAMARGLREFGVNTETAIAAMSGLMKAGDIGKESFKSIAIAAADAQKYVGIAVEDTVKRFNDLAKDPVKVLSEFTQQTGYLSQAQLQLVRDLVEAGNGADAQRVAIKLLEEGYSSMSAQAQEDMSGLGRVLTEITSTTSTMWDTFKESAGVEFALKAFKAVVEVVAISIHAVFSVVRDVATAIAFAIDVATNPTGNITAKWDAFKQSLIDNGNAHDAYAKKLIGGAEANVKVVAAERERNASAEQVTDAIGKMAAATEMNAKSQVKTMQQAEYVSARVAEEVKKHAQSLSEEQKKAFLEDERYLKLKLDAEKKYSKEWADANKSTANKAKETYSVSRDNELQETKRFYEAQLKQLKDFESKQSQINKAGYESKAITYGQYVAREVELVASSQKQQLEVIQKSEDAYRKNIEARKKAQEAAASAAKKSGANSSKINAKLTQELKNLSNESATAEESFKGLRGALENSVNAKYAKFFKELSKAIFESNEELKKFSKSVEDNARRRKEDLALEQQLLSVYGAEAEALKASTSAMRGYSGAITSANNALEDAVKHRQDLEKELSTVVGVEAYNRLSEQAREAVRVEEQLRKNAIKTTSLAQIDANQAAADAMQAYNLKVYKEIRDSLSESVYNAIFEGGSDGGKALKDSLKKMFKNYVINVILNPVMGQVAGALGFGNGAQGTSNSAGNTLGALGALSGLRTAYSMFTGGVTSTMAGAIGNLGSTFGSSAVSSFATGMKGASLAPGLAGPTTVGASGAMGAGATAANALPVVGWIAAGMAASKGAYEQGYTEKDLNWANPIGLIEKSTTRVLTALGISEKTAHILTGASLTAKIFDKLGLVATPHMGAGAIYAGGEVQEGRDTYSYANFGMGQAKEYAESAQAAVSSIAANAGVTLDAIAKTFDLASGYSVATAFADDRSKDGAWGSLRIADELGKVLVDWENTRQSKWAPKEFSDGETGYNEYLAAVQADVLTAIQAMNLPGWAKDMFTAAEGAEGLATAMAGVAEVVAMFVGLGKAMEMFADLSGDLQTRLLAASGGVEALASNAEAFYEGFFTEGERALKQRELQMAALAGMGLYIDPAEGDAAKELFRKTVEEAMGSGQVELAAQLMAMSGAFAQMADFAQQFADDAALATKSLRESLISLEGQFAGGGLSRQYQAEDAATRMQKLLSSAGVQMEVGTLSSIMMSATSAEVEHYFREIWQVLDTDAARQELVDVTDAMMSLASVSDSVADKTKALSDKITSAFEAMNSAGSLLDKIGAALGGSVNSYGLQREQRLWSALSSTTDYEKQVELAGELTNIVLERHDLEKQNAQKLINFARDLRKYVDSLKIGNLSPLTTGEKLAEAARQYTATLEKARAGDDSAMSELQNISTNYLDLARQYYASSEDYTSIFNSVTTGLEALSISSQSDAQMQLSISSQSLDQLVTLQGILEEAYGKASSEYLEQRDLLQAQIDYAEKTSTGIAVLAELLAGLPAEIGLFMSSGTSSGSYSRLAQQWVNLMQPYGLEKSADQVARELQGASAAELQHNYDIGANLLGNGAKRSEWDALFTSLREGMIDGSHRGGLDYVPFDGYIAQLHKGESVQTASENRSYGARSSNLNSSLVAEVKLLREEINLLRKENREDTDAVVTVTAKANELNAKVIVEGVNEASSKEAYSNNLGAKLR